MNLNKELYKIKSKKKNPLVVTTVSEAQMLEEIQNEKVAMRIFNNLILEARAEEEQRQKAKAEDPNNNKEG
ncbi:TPA: hypothetical protein R4339_001947 [Pasteurella multocida]|nr:hypothetical protein [Pasteurella multocida]HEA3307757.1 hypothetical protein [Pasteurella multocida]HED4445198.1 hypothetical protein [Pasteurella multocida]